MEEWTGIEIERARHGLEQASSTILGRMLFEFSRLDMALGLMLVWSNEGSQLERLTKLVAGYGFHKKLELLAELARARYQANAAALEAHTSWLNEAHMVREERNDLVHGRWGIDHMNGQVVNVVGLPTGEQAERRYTVPELKAVLVRLHRLQESLGAIRAQWPV